METGQYIPRCMPYPYLGLCDWAPVERLAAEPTLIRTPVTFRDLMFRDSRFQIDLPYRTTRKFIRRREPLEQDW